MEEDRRSRFARFLAPLTETFGLSRAVAVITFLLISLVLLFAVFWFFRSAPPGTIIITSGPPGSSFETNAVKYGQILAGKGVTLRILPSQGSLQNLERLYDPSFRVDIGFVQGGVTNGRTSRKLTSLGSVSYQPILVFRRGAAPVARLSELTGKRIAIGPVGSGTRALALVLLKLNGIEPGGQTTLLDLDADDASKALIEGTVDAVFMEGDSASPRVMRQLLLTPGIQLLDFTQADGYTRRISYLNKLELPEGSVDFGKNIPAHDIRLIGPTVELLARPDLHPALADLLIEAAQEVHGGAGLLKRKGEFPAALEHDFPINAEATRYYRSGKSFLYRYLPFWLASLVNRVLVAFVPVVVLLIPGLRFIPFVFRLRIQLHIYRWYRALLALERDPRVESTPEKRQEMLAQLEHIEEEVNKMKVPASFANQFYGLRGDIGFVRDRLANTPPADRG
jgi:TRAP-type uncharacterized transport system substrate-binding protein